MRAVVVRHPGGVDQLALEEVDDPVLQAGQVKIEVRATALNRADLLQRRGLYPPPAGASDLLGLECAGVVAEVESNDSLAGAQNLDLAFWTLSENPDVEQSTSIPHVSIQGTGDGTFDYYSFTVSNAGDIGIFDIDYGWTDGAGSMDSYILLYDSSGNLLATSDDSATSDGAGGSVSSRGVPGVRARRRRPSGACRGSRPTRWR